MEPKTYYYSQNKIQFKNFFFPICFLHVESSEYIHIYSLVNLRGNENYCVKFRRDLASFMNPLWHAKTDYDNRHAK